MRYLVALCLLTFALPAIAVDSYDSARESTPITTPQEPGTPWERPQDVIYDNCDYCDSPGTGVGGADESILQTTGCFVIPPGDWLDLNMNTLGFGHQFSLGFVVADDFTVPAGESWEVTDFHTFAYQTGSSTTSTMIGVYITIYDDMGGMPGNVVWGNYTDNLLDSTEWTGCYRVSCTNSGLDTGRPIMVQTSLVANGTSGDLTLGAGTYWMGWMTDGTLASGPWAPPCVIKNVGNTGNGLQSLDLAATWAPALDSGLDGFPQGFPFVLTGGGAPPTPTENTTWSNLKGVFTE
jgi:hypothetical protein